MIATYYDKLPDRVRKSGYNWKDIYGQILTIKESGYKYANITMSYPGEYASISTLRSALRGAVERYPDLASVFKVSEINGEVWLIRTDMD